MSLFLVFKVGCDSNQPPKVGNFISGAFEDSFYPGNYLFYECPFWFPEEKFTNVINVSFKH